jgi:hypothetical protein
MRVEFFLRRAKHVFIKRRELHETLQERPQSAEKQTKKRTRPTKEKQKKTKKEREAPQLKQIKGSHLERQKRAGRQGHKHITASLTSRAQHSLSTEVSQDDAFRKEALPPPPLSSAHPGRGRQSLHLAYQRVGSRNNAPSGVITERAQPLSELARAR